MQFPNDLDYIIWFKIALIIYEITIQNALDPPTNIPKTEAVYIICSQLRNLGCTNQP
jgi:hypothetical protein